MDFRPIDGPIEISDKRVVFATGCQHFIGLAKDVNIVVVGSDGEFLSIGTVAHHLNPLPCQTLLLMDRLV